MRIFLFFAAPAFLFGTIRSDLNIGLRALQQIRTLIPERLSTQEFAIVVDEQAFNEALKNYRHPIKEPSVPSAMSACSSRYYLTWWTISGEPVRLMDSYQQFEYGPYWRYPTALHQLDDMLSAPTNGNSK